MVLHIKFGLRTHVNKEEKELFPNLQEKVEHEGLGPLPLNRNSGTWTGPNAELQGNVRNDKGMSGMSGMTRNVRNGMNE